MFCRVISFFYRNVFIKSGQVFSNEYAEVFNGPSPKEKEALLKKIKRGSSKNVNVMSNNLLILNGEKLIVIPLKDIIGQTDENLNSILEMFFSQNKEPLMIQEYLKDVRNGDKRIILLNGKVVGAVNRIPKLGESRSNMHVGGKPVKTELTERDKFICNEISQSLIEKGLYFVGIDIIGDYITEINVTSPTGIREIKNLDSIAIDEMFWNFIEDKLEV